MDDLIYNYTHYKEEKSKFETLQQIDPKDDDSLYKYLLHKLRDLQEDLVNRADELRIDLESLKRTLELEKELIQNVDLL